MLTKRQKLCYESPCTFLEEVIMHIPGCVSIILSLLNLD